MVVVFNSVCKRRKLKVNVNKSKVMVCERRRSEVVNFVCPYRVGIECEKECKIIFNGEEMEEVNEFSTWDQLCVSMVVQKERQEKEHCNEERW